MMDGYGEDLPRREFQERRRTPRDNGLTWSPHPAHLQADLPNGATLLHNDDVST